jgi:hypothetical protein
MADFYNDGFLSGHVFHGSPYNQKERDDAIRAIEAIMIEHDIIKIDACIDPYRFPQNLIDLRNGKTR